MLKDIRIGVMLGGCSCEREVSLKSGRAVARALSANNLDVVLLELRQETEEEVRGFIDKNNIDVVFIALHGGFGEDGRLQSILDTLGVFYTGSGVQASEKAMDKYVSRKVFEEAHLAVPKYHKFRKEKDRVQADGFLYPLVVKPVRQGSSIGVSFVESATSFQKAVDEAFGFDDEILIEEFIRGRELTVSVLDGEALPVVEIIPKFGFFDFHSKYSKGLTDYVVPAFLSPDIADAVQSDAVRAYRALECRHFARIDMIVRSDSSPFILEVNTIPGLTEMSLFPKAAQAAGISFGQLCVRLIQMALEKR